MKPSDIDLLRRTVTDIWGKAIYTEFVQKTRYWEQMPANQLAKCAEAQGFRKAFPGQFAGLYTSDELATCSSGLRLVTSEPASEMQPVDGGQESSAFLPAALEPFSRDMTQRNIQAAFSFIGKEMELKLGSEGQRLFRLIWSRYRRAYRTREEARSQTLQCWREMWAHLEKEAA